MSCAAHPCMPAQSQTVETIFWSIAIHSICFKCIYYSDSLFDWLSISCTCSLHTFNDS